MRRARRGEDGSARGLLVGSGLLAAGAAAGILAGALLDAPRILLHRLQGPVSSADLETGEIVSSGDEARSARRDDSPDVSHGGELEEFAALQEEAAVSPPPAPAPELVVPPAPKPERVKPAAAKPPAERRTVAAREPRKPAGPSAEALIREIAERTESPSPPPPPAEPASLAPAAPAKPKPATPQNEVRPRAGPVVQVGAFGSSRDAAAAASKLRGQGYDCYVSEKLARGRYQHRVRVRPNGSSAAALAAELERRGYDVWITKE